MEDEKIEFTLAGIIEGYSHQEVQDMKPKEIIEKANYTEKFELFSISGIGDDNQ